MSDSDILDALYDWAAGYAERKTPCDCDRRLYSDAIDDALAIMAPRVWEGADGPDEELTDDRRGLV